MAKISIPNSPARWASQETLAEEHEENMAQLKLNAVAEAAIKLRERGARVFTPKCLDILEEIWDAAIKASNS